MQPLLTTASLATTQQQLSNQSQLGQKLAVPPTAAGKHAPSIHLSTLQCEVSERGFLQL